MSILTKLFASRIVGGTIGPMFAYLKGKKTWIGLVGMVVIAGAETFLPVPGYAKPILDQIFYGLVGATSVSGGDKIRRVWEGVKKTGDIVVDSIPVPTEPTK